MLNEVVRKTAKSHGVKQWEIAMELGIGENTLTRWLRVPLPADKEACIMAAIEKLAAEKGA